MWLLCGLVPCMCLVLTSYMLSVEDGSAENGYSSGYSFATRSAIVMSFSPTPEIWDRSRLLLITRPVCSCGRGAVCLDTRASSSPIAAGIAPLKGHAASCRSREQKLSRSTRAIPVATPIRRIGDICGVEIRIAVAPRTILVIRWDGHLCGPSAIKSWCDELGSWSSLFVPPLTSSWVAWPAG